MFKFQLSRTMYRGGKQVRNAINLRGHNHARAVTVVAGADKYEVQDLSSAKPFEDIPKIPTIPFIGSSWVYFPLIGRYSVEYLHLADRHKHKTYGDIVREQFGHLSIVNSYVPETMEILNRHEGKYPTRGEITTLKAYRDSRPEWYKTGGVMILQGHEWADFRSKTQKHLMKPKTIQAYLDPMQDVAKDFVNLISGKRNSKKEVDGLLEDLYKWSLESVAYVGLDTRLGCLNPNLTPGSDGAKLIETVQTQFYCMNQLEAFAGNFPFWKYLPSPTWNKFVKVSDLFTEIAFKYINLSLDNLKKINDDADLTMLQSMLLTKELDVSGIMVMVADMLFAGVDTTSHTVGFLFYHLAKNPDKQKIVAEEIRQLLPNKTDRITPEVFNKLHYLKACLKESIRMDPIVRGNGRILDHDVVLSGYRVPAGTTIFCVLQEICRDERYYKNPNQFIPERWMDKDEKLMNPFSYVPFGVGTRSCIGRRLAELEILCVSTEIIRKFSVEYHHEDIGMITRLISIPDKPLRFSFLDR